MAPLILHNVPDEECYVGEDGVKRPYAMYFNTYVKSPGLLCSSILSDTDMLMRVLDKTEA